ncbi:MAG: hypothetical protein M1113_04355 [Candidatus Thermoplasmatota archaeon]|jgi:hypothetical protein|nr:hypothetical protein [Candidatus Thermoplasmatota archaeon]
MLKKVKKKLFFVTALYIFIVLISLFFSPAYLSTNQYNPNLTSTTVADPPHWLFNGSYANYLFKCGFSTVNNSQVAGRFNYTGCCTYKIYNVSLSKGSYSTLREVTNPKNGSLLCNIQYGNVTNANLTNASLPVMLSAADLNYFSENQLPPDNDINNPVLPNTTLTTGLMVLKGNSTAANKKTVKVYEISKNETVIRCFTKISIFSTCNYSAYSGLLLNGNYLYNSTHGNVSYLGFRSLNLTSTNISVVPAAVLNIFTVDYSAILVTPILVAVAAIAILYYRKKI